MRQLWFEVKSIFITAWLSIFFVTIVYCIQTQQYSQAFILAFYTIFIVTGFVYMIQDRRNELDVKSEKPENKG